MTFAFLVFAAAFLIEAIGSYISIVGLSALFSTDPVIIILALSLDIAKIITVSFLYKKWDKINGIMKAYMTSAAAILMIITSSGAAGYLSAEFQKAILPTKGSDIVVQSMMEEKTKLEARKVEIDTQIAQLPAESVKGRQRLAKQFDAEISRINDRIVEIDQKLPELKLKQIDVNAHAGPILYVAEAFNTTVESAVKYVILLIIFVFDPLAISLIIAGNFLVDQHKKEQDEISKKLDDIKREVDHIEEEITSQEEKVSKNDPIQQEIVSTSEVNLTENEVADVKPMEEEEEEETNKIEDTLASQILVAENEEILASFEKSQNEVGAEVRDLTSEEASLENRQEEASKRKRGRKKKEESEPKPSIVSDDQLNGIIQAEQLELLDPEFIETTENILNEVKTSLEDFHVEEIHTEDNLDVVITKEETEGSSLKGLSCDNSDVFFNYDAEHFDKKVEASKKVINTYS
jgi:hypothetical protein